MDNSNNKDIELNWTRIGLEDSERGLLLGEYRGIHCELFRYNGYCSVKAYAVPPKDFEEVSEALEYLKKGLLELVAKIEEGGRNNGK